MWSINGGNLCAHFESNQRSAFNKLVRVFPHQDLVKKLPPPDLAKEDKNEASHPPSKKSNTKAITVDKIFTNSLKKRLSSMTLDVARCAVFDTETCKMLFLEYLMANNLSFAHADNPAIAVLLAHTRRCDSVDSPTVDRQSMRVALDIVYRESVDDLKSKLAKHKGNFTLTLDEWKSGNYFDFLAVSLHYHDYDFKMRKYAIGFEVLNKDVSYTGEVLYRHLDSVLTEYNVKDRIISITRDNASQINSLVKKLKASLDNDETGEEFSGNLRCFGHVLNLGTNAFLSCVQFKISKFQTFLDLLNENKEKLLEFMPTMC